jgi:hypothetical protein
MLAFHKAGSAYMVVGMVVGRPSDSDLAGYFEDQKLISLLERRFSKEWNSPPKGAETSPGEEFRQQLHRDVDALTEEERWFVGPLFGAQGKDLAAVKRLGRIGE